MSGNRGGRRRSPRINAGEGTPEAEQSPTVEQDEVAQEVEMEAEEPRV